MFTWENNKYTTVCPFACMLIWVLCQLQGFCTFSAFQYWCLCLLAKLILCIVQHTYSMTMINAQTWIWTCSYMVIIYIHSLITLVCCMMLWSLTHNILSHACMANPKHNITKSITLYVVYHVFLFDRASLEVIHPNLHSKLLDSHSDHNEAMLLGFTQSSWRLFSNWSKLTQHIWNLK